MIVFFIAVGIVAAFLLAIVLAAIVYSKRAGKDVPIETVYMDETGEMRQVLFNQRVLPGGGKRRRMRKHTRG